MDLNSLRLFKDVVDCAGLSAGGEKSGMNPNVVSRKIATLEEDVGEKLMSRSRGGIFLTEEGEILYNFSCRMLALEGETLEEIQNRGTHIKGPITIHTTMGTLNTWLVDCAVEFQEIYPGIRLKMFSTNDPITSANRFADVIIGPPQKAYDGLEKIFIKSFHLTFFASKNYLKKNGTPKEIKDLKDHQLISFSEGYPNGFGNVDWFLSNKDKKIEPYMNINSSEGLLRAARLDAGIVYLGKEFVEEKGGRLVDLFPGEPGERIDLCYLYNKNLKNIKRIVVFGEFLNKKFNKNSSSRS